MKKIQLKIPGLTNYLIDNKGNVYNSLTNRGNPIKTTSAMRKVKSFPNKNTSYHQVVLQNKENGVKPTALYIHRLVAEHFIPNPDNLPEVNHKNLNKQDNRVDNLEWVTRKQNMKHSMENGAPRKNKNPKMEKIYSDKKLLKEGIQHFRLHRNFNQIAKMWDCSALTARKIMRKENEPIVSNIRVGIEVYEDIKKEILSLPNPRKFPRGYTDELIFKMFDKWGIVFNYFTLRRLKVKILKEQGLFGASS
jgi:hypothetical protein